MLKNYLKVAWRNIKKHKGYSFINIAGLAIGMACFIVILLYVLNECSYDTYHQDVDRIFRVALEIDSNSGSTKYAMNVPPVGPALQEDFPQVEYAARVFYYHSKRIVKHGDKIFYEDGFVYADQDIFNILTIPFIHGNPENSLSQPQSLVIPERLAAKYFGNDEPIGKTLNVNDRDYVISGVIADSPQNTTMPFDIFLSMQDLRNPPWMTDWTWPGMYTYIKLTANVDANAFDNQIRHFADNYLEGDIRAEGKTYQQFLQPITDIYLSSNLEYDLVASNPVYLYIFSAVGIIVLLVACLNFMNLTTARAANRAKEVGMRKVVGAEQTQLIKQFFGESLLMTVAAFVAALVIVELASSFVHNLTGIELQLSKLFQPSVFSGMCFLVLFVGFTAGSYPAFVLSAYRPILVIKGILSAGSTGSVMRKIMVVGQFAISIILIVCTIIVFHQVDYMKNKDLGLNKDQKLIIPVRGRVTMADNYKSIKNEFMKNPAVTGAAISSNVPGQGAGSLNTSLIGEDDPKSQMMYYNFCDSDFIPEFNIELISGRNFIRENRNDIFEACIINEAAVKAFGWTSAAEAIGKQIETGLRNAKKEIIGVVNDFHYRSVQYSVEPLIIEYDPTMFGHISLSVNIENFDATIKSVERNWQELFPGKPFEYFFMDDFFNQMYKSEEQMGKLFTLLTMMGIFIACLGLFGLASFMSELRTKEIGIRKVLGASVTEVVFLFSKEFTVWVLVANIIAWPIAYFAMHKWLQSFAHQVNLEMWMFAVSALIALFIALLTVSYQSIKAATANPIKALKYE